jgi:hemerythrin-like domain-containing protein
MLDRRKFISFIPASIAGFGLFAGLMPGQGLAAAKQAQVGAIETLTRGHGLLLRATLIYEVAGNRTAKGEKIDPSLVQTTAQVIRRYLHDFHEMMEEKYIFAPLELSKICFSSIQELKVQHGTSYELTQRILKLTAAGKLNTEVVGYMTDYTKMYTHHTAWEDTVIFPAFDSLEKKRDIDELAATFSAEERKILGNDGFDSFLGQIAEVEKQLNIFELSTSTAKIS